MATKFQVDRECARKNQERGVNTKGKTSCSQFCRNIGTSTLLSGGANWNMIRDSLVREYVKRNDMPTIVLTVVKDWTNVLEEIKHEKMIHGYMVSDSTHLNYHVFCGMRREQILQVIELTADEVRITRKDQVMNYAKAFMTILQSVYRLSLPAMLHLAKESDERICEIGRSKRVPEHVLDSFKSSREAGDMFRRLLEKLEVVFESVTDRSCSSHYSLLSGAMAKVPFMVFYQSSSCQPVMNRFLRLELENMQKHYGKFRVILDDTYFCSERDELLEYLMKQKRLCQMELVVCSINAPDMLKNDSNLEGFESVAVFPHQLDATTERITAMFKTYRHYETVVAVQKPGTFVLPHRASVQYTMQVSDRLKVRGQDLRPDPVKLFGGDFQVAIKQGMYTDKIELVSLDKFLKAEKTKGAKR